jgi:hypothetical protein
MDFKFLLNIDLLTFLMVFIVFGFWQILKLAIKKEIDPKVITSVNGAIAIVFAVIVVGFGLDKEVFSVIVKAGAVFASGSFFDLLKAYGAVK